MKEFEKQLAKQKQYYKNRSGTVKKGYRMALEWVQSRLKFGSEVAYSSDDILMAIKKEIREELEK